MKLIRKIKSILNKKYYITTRDIESRVSKLEETVAIQSALLIITTEGKQS